MRKVTSSFDKFRIAFGAPGFHVINGILCGSASWPSPTHGSSYRYVALKKCRIAMSRALGDGRKKVTYVRRQVKALQITCLAGSACYSTIHVGSGLATTARVA